MEAPLQLVLEGLAMRKHPDDDGGGGGDQPGDRIPRDPRGLRFEGPWLQQQLLLSATIGIFSFVAFSYIRRRAPALFAPRTKLKGFSTNAGDIDSKPFSWIMPTLKAKEVKILHVVGLDAAVLLSFFKMAFWVFVFIGAWSCVVLMPTNYIDHGSIDGVAPSEEPKPEKPGGDASEPLGFLIFGAEPGPQMPWTWRIELPSTYHIVHLVSTYIFTLMILRALYTGLGKFIRARQLYALDLLQSIPARTVEVRDLPDHLQKEKDLAEYFEGMGLAVESTVVVREVRGLKSVIAQRARALFALEREWCNWLGNPTSAENYDPDTVAQVSQERAQVLAKGGEALVLAMAQGERDVEQARLLGGARDMPDPADGIRSPQGKARPLSRLSSWNPWSPKVDSLTLLEARYRALDATVQKLRRKGAPPSSVGFVTFVDGMSAQIAAQAVHYPLPGACATTLAPEPRDIIWANISIPLNERRVRTLIVSAFTIALFLFYIPPLTFLASLLSPKVIEKYLPGLSSLLKKNERLEAFVETSLPSVAVISFNALLPLVLEWSAYLQGLKARSLVEFSVLKRYYIFLLTSVIFIFLIATTALGVIADLAGNPMRIIDKLAQSLPRARQFSLSYVVFQALAVMPLQLMQLPVIIGRYFGRLFAKTPRDFAELSAPPELYAGSVYPSALIVFTLCILYSIVMPLITVFGALYFALAYLVYKYKLLFVFYRSYESRGQAWPLCSARIVWALGLFQLFQLSLFSVRKQFLLSTLMLPLITFTIWFGIHLSRVFGQLSEFVSLSSIAEVNRPRFNVGGESTLNVTQPSGDDITPSPHVVNTAAATPENERLRKRRDQSQNPIVAMRDAALNALDPDETVLSRKRYASKDETLFVAKRDRHTDYREPPAGGYYYGVLNTGRRRYGHPALTGTLPEFWPPVREDDFDKEDDRESVDGNASEPTSAQPAATSPAQPKRGRLSSLIHSSKLRQPRGPLVLSLRRRKSSLISNGGSRGSRTRQAPPTTINEQPKDSAKIAAGKVAATGEDEDCNVPGHQHEAMENVWGQSSQPDMQNGKATGNSGQERGEGPSAYIRPVRGSDYRDEPAAPGNRAMNADDNNEEDDDDSEDDFAGVYVHRTAHHQNGSDSFLNDRR